MRLATILVLAGLAAAQADTLEVTPTERAAAGAIRPELIRAHIRFLASDLLEGRGPATRGDRLAQEYIAAQLEAVGLEPGAPDGGWYQPFDIVGITSLCPETLTFERDAEQVALVLGDEYIAFSGIQEPEARIDDAEVVFVGYGIQAPEYGWDDYKGANLEGKVLLFMNNDPEDDPELFEGRTRLYYGRWDYKYEMAAQQGAAGAIIIHTDPSAGYPWSVVQTSWAGEGFSLPSQGEPRVAVQAWTTDAASRRIVQLGGKDLDALRAAAESKDFRPVSLGVRLSLTLTNRVARKQTANVIGRLPGGDPELSGQAVIYTAHFDHLGKKPSARGGEDTIYNGALDNASGVAGMLAIAQAFAELPDPPRRSVLFAAVAAEEQGLLGSEYLAAHPPLHPGRLAANINIDGLNVIGRTRDITMIGLGKSSLDDWVHELAELSGRTVLPDQFPDKGFFYRSDQFNLAKIGVPAAYFDSGTQVIGKPEGWGRQQARLYETQRYHQPSDELSPEWDLAGAVEDSQLCFHLGVAAANADEMPSWRPGDEFEAARQSALAGAGQ